MFFTYRLIARVFALILCALSAGSVLLAEKPKPNRHVVVVVWDGMRPDFISEKNTPVLWKFAHEGVIFRNHHAVYPSATNDAFMGKLPEHGGIFLADKIGSHPVPNHNYHMSVGFRFLCQQDAAC